MRSINIYPINTITYILIYPNIVYDLVPISTIMDGGLDVDYLVGKVALLNSINLDLIIISTIMLL